jgi:hypothetical protein
LRNIDGARSGQSCAKNRRNQARRIKTVRDAGSEWCFAAKCSDRWIGCDRRSPQQSRPHQTRR